MRIKLDPSQRVEDLVLLELKAELIAGSLQVRPQAVSVCHTTSTLYSYGTTHCVHSDLKVLLCLNISIEQRTVVCELKGMCSLTVAEYSLLATVQITTWNSMCMCPIAARRATVAGGGCSPGPGCADPQGPIASRVLRH